MISATITCPCCGEKTYVGTLSFTDKNYETITCKKCGQIYDVVREFVPTFYTSISK